MHEMPNGLKFSEETVGDAQFINITDIGETYRRYNDDEGEYWDAFEVMEGEDPRILEGIDVETSSAVGKVSEELMAAAAAAAAGGPEDDIVDEDDDDEDDDMDDDDEDEDDDDASGADDDE